MDQSVLDSIRRIPAFDSLLVLARRSDGISLQVYREGVFDEAAFMISGQLAILQRYGLIELLYEPPVPTAWTNLQLRYRLTPSGRQFVEGAALQSAGLGPPQSTGGAPVQ